MPRPWKKWSKPKGSILFYESIENRKLCCGIRKVEPLQSPLANVDAWITGLRRQQSVSRADDQIIEWDQANDKIKINPLINWSLEHVHAYIKEHKMDINPLHAKGFISIGCAPCTRAVKPGEDIRAGRWWWEQPEQKECGLHNNLKWKGITVRRVMSKTLDKLDALESQSVYILREAYREFKSLVMLWSIGKDSTVLLWLARKAFFGHVPFPLVHIDTSYKIPEMIRYRDELALKFKLNMIVGQNTQALKDKRTFPDGALDRISCCKALKTDALKNTLSGAWPRLRLNHKTGKYEVDTNTEPYIGVIVGARADEEGSRSKERYFSPRDRNSDWDVGDQPPELWNQFKTDFAPGTHIRIHPLLDWTELNIWEYIQRENIPITHLYFDQGNGKRYRSLGCYPCTTPVDSTAKNVADIVKELREGKFKNIAERSGRAQDKEDGGGLETLRKEGYM